MEGSTARVSNFDILITLTIDSHIVVLVLQVEEHRPQILQLIVDGSGDIRMVRDSFHSNLLGTRSLIITMCG